MAGRSDTTGSRRTNGREGGTTAPWRQGRGSGQLSRCLTRFSPNAGIVHGDFPCSCASMELQLSLCQEVDSPMAQHTVVKLVDDIDGTEIADNQGETVTF